MRIATPTTASTIAPADAYDVVPPSRLFDLAALRFESALATLRIGGPGTAPSGIVTVMALQQASSGLNSLQSINVPSAPFEVRTRAANAIDHARQGIDLLRLYHARVANLGDRAHDTEALSSETLGLLEGGRLRLQTSIAIARNS